MHWLSQTREALRKKEISLSGPFEPAPEENEAIQRIIHETRNLIDSLGSEERNARPATSSGREKTQKLTDAFCEQLERSLVRIVKGRNRGIRKGHADKTEITDQGTFQQLLQQYQESIGLILGWSGKLTGGVFKAASAITPYWEAKELAELLTNKNIQKALAEKGGGDEFGGNKRAVHGFSEKTFCGWEYHRPDGSGGKGGASFNRDTDG